MRLSRQTYAVYVVYAISSLDTEGSLRHGTQTAWGFVGTQQGVARRAEYFSSPGRRACVHCLAAGGSTHAPHTRSGRSPTLRMVSSLAARVSLTLAVAVLLFFLAASIGRRRRQTTTAAELGPPPAHSCKSTVLEAVQSAKLAFVITWSSSSRGATGNYSGELFSGLVPLTEHYRDDGGVVFVVDAKGSRCSELPRGLDAMLRRGRLHCIQGPNRAAREAHTVLHFCLHFYDHMPRAAVFVQDDPDFLAIKNAGVGEDRWFRRLEAAHRGRASQPRSRAASPFDQPFSIPCPCWIQKEGNLELQETNVSELTYGHYRTVTWWMRTFVRPHNERTVPLPRRLWFPAHAQLAVTRRAVRSRSRRFYEVNEALAGLPSPRKPRSVRAAGEAERECVAWKKIRRTGLMEHARAAGEELRRALHDVKQGGDADRRECLMTKRERRAKWANFGPWVVDLGEGPLGAADRRPAAHGMDVAMMYERLWFTIFDPQMEERLPSRPECYTREALLEGPVRCGRETCPHDPPNPGLGGEACAATDRLGLTRPPVASSTLHTAAGTDPSSSKCLELGCLVATSEDVRAMLRSRGRAQDACDTEACRGAVHATDWVSARCSRA